MIINKDSLKLILNNKKKIEKLYDKFIINYLDFFNKNTNIEYDEIFSLDLEIYSEFLNFASLLIKIDYNDKDINDSHIKKILLDLLETTKIVPEEYYKMNEFDFLYYSYILCQMYIIYPYILESYYFQYYLQKYPSWHIDKIQYNAKVNKLSNHLIYTIKCFEMWDKVESKIERLSFDENEKHPKCLLTYIEIKKTFSNLMNNFILIKNDIKISNKILLKAKIIANWYWLLIIGVIILVVIILLFIFNR